MRPTRLRSSPLRSARRGPRDANTSSLPSEQPAAFRCLVSWSALLTLVASVGLASSDPAPPLGPGAADLRLSGLRAFEAVYVDRRGTVEGSRTHRLERLTVNERPAWRFTITMHGAGVVEDEVVFDAATAAPLARRIFAPGLVHRVEIWDGASLRWVDVKADASGAQTHDRRFEIPPLATPPDLLVATLDLEPGDRRFARSFSTDLGADAPGFLLDVLAEARETITTPAGRFECLRVRTEMRTLTDSPADAAPLGLPARTLWISSEPPYLIRASAEMAGTTFEQELKQIRWIGPAPAADAGVAQAGVLPTATPDRGSATVLPEQHHGGLMHRLVNWFHGIHGKAHP